MIGQAGKCTVCGKITFFDKLQPLPEGWYTLETIVSKANCCSAGCAHKWLEDGGKSEDEDD